MRVLDNKTVTKASSNASLNGGEKLGEEKTVADTTLGISNDTAVCTPSPPGKQKLGASDAAPPAKRSKVCTEADKHLVQRAKQIVFIISLLSLFDLDCESLRKLFGTRSGESQGFSDG